MQVELIKYQLSTAKSVTLLILLILNMLIIMHICMIKLNNCLIRNPVRKLQQNKCTTLNFHIYPLWFSS